MITDTGFRALQPQEYPAILPLFQEQDDQLAPLSVLHSAAAGQVYTAGVVGVPVASILLVAGHRYYLAGKVDDPDFSRALHGWLEHELLALRSAGEWGLVLYYAQPAWQKVVEQILAGRGAYPASRLVYERVLSPDQPLEQPLLPAGYCLNLVDTELLAEADLAGRDGLLAELCSERSSAEDFLARSYGYALLQDANIAGWCLSEYNLGMRCEVGIATLEGHQRRGLATASGLAFLELARQHGMRRIGWHCWARNLASARTAERLGFHLVREYTCYCCPA
jgi:GNAT superfamily N-acetyltransferase